MGSDPVVKGVYRLVHTRKGVIINMLEGNNSIKYTGLCTLYDKTLCSGSNTKMTLYCGLLATLSATPGRDATMGSLSTYSTLFTGISSTYWPTWIPDTTDASRLSTNIISNYSPMVFHVNTTGNINGFYLGTAQSKTYSGILWATFATDTLECINGDVLYIQYTIDFSGTGV